MLEISNVLPEAFLVLFQIFIMIEKVIELWHLNFLSFRSLTARDGMKYIAIDSSMWFSRSRAFMIWNVRLRFRWVRQSETLFLCFYW